MEPGRQKKAHEFREVHSRVDKSAPRNAADLQIAHGIRHDSPDTTHASILRFGGLEVIWDSFRTVSNSLLERDFD